MHSRLYKLIQKLTKSEEIESEDTAPKDLSKICHEIIEEVGQNKTISSSTNFLYLNALVSAEKFELYFNVAIELMMVRFALRGKPSILPCRRFHNFRLVLKS